VGTLAADAGAGDYMAAMDLPPSESEDSDEESEGVAGAEDCDDVSRRQTDRQTWPGAVSGRET
jgi:hypothetical protein